MPRLARKRTRWALLATLLLSPGCGTIGHLALAPAKKRWNPYGGVQTDIMCVGGQISYLPAWLMTPLALIDLPFSAVLDTLLLPITGITTAAGH